LPLQALAWILLLKIVELPSEVRLWKKCPQVLKIYGLILDAEALLCCSRTVPSILARRWMAVGELS
jgi:hypothetical protein